MLEISCCDLSIESVNETKIKGFDSFQVDLNDYFVDKINKKFDLVLASGIFEHLQFSKFFMDQITQIAKKYLLIQVTNHFYWSYRLNFLLNKPPKFFVGSRGHSSFFNLNHIKKLLLDDGFTIIELKSTNFLEKFFPSLFSRAFTILE